MRALGLALVVVGYLWLVLDYRTVGAIWYPATTAATESLAVDSTRVVPVVTLHETVDRAVRLAVAAFPNPLWPGSMMLAGGVLLWFGRRRVVSKGVL